MKRCKHCFSQFGSRLILLPLRPPRKQELPGSTLYLSFFVQAIAFGLKKKKLRWYPQQPQRCIFTNLSEACCEANRWKHFRELNGRKSC